MESAMGAGSKNAGHLLRSPATYLKTKTRTRFAARLSFIAVVTCDRGPKRLQPAASTSIRDFDNSSNKSSHYTHDYKCLTENWLRLFKNCSGGSSSLWILLASAGAHPYCSLTILAKKTVPISMKLNGLTENWLRLFKNVQSGGTGHPHLAASDTMLRSPA